MPSDDASGRPSRRLDNVEDTAKTIKDISEDEK